MADSKPAPDRPWARPLRLILAATGIVLVLAAGLAWLNRKALARDALTGWLRSKGVAANAQVEAFGPTTFTARLTLGDPRNPDFAAERAEVRYRPRLGGIEVVSVTLKKPVLRASIAGGKFSAGSLDPLVREFLRRPPPPGAKVPRIQVDGGVLMLGTDYGPLRVAGDVLVDDGQLRTLTATSAPARVKGRGLDATLGAGSLRVATRSNRTDASLTLPVVSATFGGRTLLDGRLALSLQGPYPDMVKRRGEGPVTLRAGVTARRLAGAGQDIGGLRLAMVFDGRTAGWIETLTIAGRATLDLAADTVHAGGGRAGPLRARLVSDDVRWARTGDDRVTATARATATADRVSAGDLALDRLGLDGVLSLAAARNDLRLSARGRVDGRGLWTGLGAPLATDAPEMAALKRAARAFCFEAPAMQGDLVRGPAGALRFGYRLDRPLSVRPDSGGEVRVAMTAGGPIRITSAGGGLPEADARLARLSNSGADLVLSARRLGFGSLQGGQVDAAGRLGFGAGGLSFAATRCVAFQVARLEFGANDVEQLSGRLCPARGPMFRLAEAGWSGATRVEGVAASVPFAQLRADGGTAVIAAQGHGDSLAVQARVTAGRLSDTAPQTRFNPLAISGPVSLRRSTLRADLAVQTLGGTPLGQVGLTHDMGRGFGGAAIETETLTFAEGGLQPAGLAPMASAIGSPAAGSAHFAGRFDWAAQGVSNSSGVLSVLGLDFTSPAGPVRGLKGEIVFESLAPLRAAPGQALSVAEIQSFVPLTGLSAQFSLADDLLTVAGGEAEVGGGKVRVETLQIPLVPGRSMRGVLIFEGVQLHDFVEASPFGDKVEFDARVSGRVPFEAAGSRVRISGGELKAIAPGRISIDRAALTGVSADTEVMAAPALVDPNATFTDFAYQAMENLAFDTLDASLASRDDGRLGVLFHIIGRHDPPTRQRIKLGLMDLIQKRFLGRKLPLPSGTKVNLTLDTSLNLDDLLSDWSEYQKARDGGGSPAVQP